MKKILLSLITLTLFGFANAQSRNKGTFEITPKIGYTSFSESNNNDYTNSNSSVAFGATADYYFNNRWSLRSGLLFNQMGGKYSITTTDNNNIFLPFTNYYEDKLNYLNVPINANWHFGSTRKWNLNFGLTPSFLINSKVVEDDITYNIPKDMVKTFQLGFTYGIGYKIEITKKFGILLDYQGFIGLTNINISSSSTTRNIGDNFNIGGVFEL